MKDADAPSSALSDHARATLTVVLDCLIPPDESRGLEGAGALGLAAYVEAQLGAAVTTLVPGLDALDARIAGGGSGEGDGADFVSADAAARHAALESIEREDPGFLRSLVFHAYTGYYQRAEVLDALGIPGRPPHPLGYEMEAGDPSLLDPVRRRGPLYRAV